MSIDRFKSEVLTGKNKYFRYAYSITGNKELAEDIVQDVMLKIWNRREGWDDIKNLQAWCLRMTRNLSIDRLRIKAYKGESLERVENHFYHDPGPVEITMNNELRAILMRVIDELPEGQQEVIRLRDILGYSYKEMSEVLQWDLNTVKVTLFRARKKLREQLASIKIYE